jgi:hypothetical protein
MNMAGGYYDVGMSAARRREKITTDAQKKGISEQQVRTVVNPARAKLREGYKADLNKSKADLIRQGANPAYQKQQRATQERAAFGRELTDAERIKRRKKAAQKLLMRR